MKALAVLLLLASVVAAAPRREVVRATVFARTARAGGGKSPCLGRRVTPSDWGIAHRTRPCGELVRVTNLRTGLVVVAPVIDRGPWGACRPGTSGKGCAWFVKRRSSEPGTWRGGADLTPTVAAALGVRSFDRVELSAP